MNDSTVKACLFAAMIVTLYAVYISVTALTGHDVPDGIVFGSVLAAIVGVGGFVVGKTVTVASKKG